MFSRKYFASKYKTYYKSLRSLRDAVKENDNLSTVIYNFKKSNCVNKSVLDNCTAGFTTKNLKGITAKTLSTIQSYVDQQKKPSTKKTTQNNNYNLSQQILEACSLIQNKFTRKNVVLSSAAVAVAAETKVESGIVNADASDKVIDAIPEPPVIPEGSEELIVNQLNALGEPTFASLGLGGASPVGWVQSCFEYLHVGLGIPWWEAIIIGTFIIRTMLFPLVVIAQRNAARMNNYLPQMQSIQLKMTEARQMGNQIDTARYSQELMIFMKEKGLNPFKNMIVPLAQMPVFVSFFMALREMSNTPVASLRDGGLWWFTDLTVPDQYFLMPIITSATLYLTIELGTDSARLSAQNLQTMKYVLRALPLVVLPFTVNFPGAILCYWVSSNFISLAQVGLLRIPSVRDYFKIEQLVTHRPENLPIRTKGFTEGIKDSWTNMKITNELEERRKLDEIQFNRAGKGPIVKTYKFDPTKQTDPKAIHAKKM